MTTPTGPDDRGRDERPQVAALLTNIKSAMPELRSLLEQASSHWGYQDPVYRFWHQSLKVFGLQASTLAIAQRLRALAPPEVALHEWFDRIVTEGTGKQFSMEDNQRWLEVTRPIVEAFFHARFMLEMAVEYGERLDVP